MNSSFSSELMKLSRTCINAAFGSLGFELRRKPLGRGIPKSPPPLFDDPIEAMYHQRGGENALFKCPVNRLVELKGFGFGEQKWHPMVNVTNGYNQYGYDVADRLLSKYYRTHHPDNAAEALPGFADSPALFAEAPSHIYYLAPWNARSAETIDSLARAWTYQENVANGRDDLFLDPHGFMMHGPVHRAKRKLELRRLTQLVDSIRNNGFSPGANINVRVLKRNDELLFVVNGGGHHRASVVAALGYEWVPARFYPGPIIIDVAEAELWPSVRSGVWSIHQARAYVDYLFDFDSRAWAESRGLLLEQNIPHSKAPE
ncbi:hypothetical protein [Marinobacter salicampi]|uniref:hypothetical protein n=1 Tax=Marinobacter salicampi TaxID=435907 RepID=UPI00140A0337|nr:hypothetical protein [Marinobacter salicampi]